jgi:hypothetical protein
MDDQLTPEERYDLARGTYTTLPASLIGPALDALRDMIASLDAELGRATETINRLEQEAERDMIRLSCILDRQRARIAALESPGGDEGT